MKKIVMIWVLALIVTIVTACTSTGATGQLNSENVETKQGIDMKQVMETIPVETMRLTKETIDEEVYTFGYLEPKESYFVTPFSTGIVEEINVSIGDVVSEGDLLYQLESNNLELSNDRDMLQQESSVTNAKSALEIQELNLKQRKGDLESRELSLNSAKENYENTLNLFENEFVSKADMDTALGNYEQAQINYEQAVISYETTQSNYDLSKASYDNALKNYELAQKDFKEKRDDIAIVAPISGLVTDVTVQTGVMNSGNLGVTIIDSSDMILNVKIMEKYKHTIMEGQKVRLISEYMDEDVIGEVTGISLTANSGLYSVEITINNQDNILSSGMYVEGYIQIKTKENVYVVDKTTVLKEINNNSYVYIVDHENQTAKKVSVELGIKEDDRVEIMGDLEAGDEVIVIGQDYVIDGQPIVIGE